MSSPEAEIKRLEDIIRREAWLEWAGERKLESPYVPWSTYDALLKETEALRAKLRDICALAR